MNLRKLLFCIMTILIGWNLAGCRSAQLSDKIIAGQRSEKIQIERLGDLLYLHRELHEWQLLGPEENMPGEDYPKVDMERESVLI
jgi:hypothetical protein